jgi:hypothetical protein
MGIAFTVALASAAACGRIGIDTSTTAAMPDANRSSASYKGAVLLVEHFDDASFAARGWYDGPGGLISTIDHAPGSVASFECRFDAGSTSCLDGGPQRHGFASTDALYVAQWAKRSTAARGTIALANAISDADAMFVGPFSSHLDVVLNIDDGGAALAIVTDSLNVDPACVKTTGGGIVGCGGNFDTYSFGEARAVSACNGVAPDAARWACEPETGSPPYSNAVFFASTATPLADDTWHFIESFVAMNSIAGGIGQHDGTLRYWVDGTLVLASDQMLLRTGALPQLGWNQLFFGPYINTGAPAAQSIWLDELTVAVGVR